jgi:hypothetical protein
MKRDRAWSLSPLHSRLLAAALGALLLAGVAGTLIVHTVRNDLRTAGLRSTLVVLEGALVGHAAGMPEVDSARADIGVIRAALGEHLLGPEDFLPLVRTLDDAVRDRVVDPHEARALMAEVADLAARSRERMAQR